MAFKLYLNVNLKATIRIITNACKRAYRKSKNGKKKTENQGMILQVKGNLVIKYININVKWYLDHLISMIIISIFYSPEPCQPENRTYSSVPISSMHNVSTTKFITHLNVFLYATCFFIQSDALSVSFWYSTIPLCQIYISLYFKRDIWFVHF